MRIALDTNILVYAEGVNGAARRDAVLSILENLPPDSVFLPAQALGEFFHVLVRKAGRSPGEARSALLGWRNAYQIIDTSAAVLMAAADLTLHQFGIWDAIILSAAAEAGCTLLLSEDMQSGFVSKGITIINPFQQPVHPLLQALLTPPTL